MCCFYLVFHNKQILLKQTASIKCFILYIVATEKCQSVLLCIWLHLRDDLKVHCSVVIYVSCYYQRDYHCIFM